MRGQLTDILQRAVAGRGQHNRRAVVGGNAAGSGCAVQEADTAGIIGSQGKAGSVHQIQLVIGERINCHLSAGAEHDRA